MTIYSSQLLKTLAIGISFAAIIFFAANQTTQEMPEPSKPLLNDQFKETMHAREPRRVVQDTENFIRISDVQDSIKLSMALKRSVIQTRSTSSQKLPMLVSLSTEDIRLDKRPPIDLVCVIDKSGSMQDQDKIGLVRQTLISLLNYLQDSDSLSIVTFDHDSSILFPLTEITKENKAKILSSIQEIQAGGSTNIAAGMNQAFEVITRQRDNGRVSSIFLLSDGQDMVHFKNTPSMVLQNLRSMEVPEDTIIHTFGFGSDHDSEVMTAIADLRGGDFYYIDKLDTVDEAFIDKLGGIMSSIAKNVQVRVRPEQSDILQRVEITKAYGDKAMWRKEKNEVYITGFNNLIRGKRRDFLLELSIPSTRKEFRSGEKFKVASVEVEILGLDGEVMKKEADLYVTLIREGEEWTNNEEDNRDVMKNYYRVKSASVMEEAKRYCEQGMYREADDLLKRYYEELERSYLKEDEFIISLQEAIKIAIQDVQPDVYDKTGKHNLLTNSRTQLYQSSNVYLSNAYMNDLQRELINEIQSRKQKIEK